MRAAPAAVAAAQATGYSAVSTRLKRRTCSIPLARVMPQGPAG